MTPIPRLPRPLRWALRLTLGPDDRRVVASELAELHAARREREGERAARAWFRRQTRGYAFRLLGERLRRREPRPLPSAPRRPGGGGPREALRTLGREVFWSLRSLGRTPGLTATIVLTVGLGIGGAATVFAAVWTVMLKPLPYQAPERLVRIYRDHPPHRWPLSVVDYQALEDQQSRFEGIAAYRNTSVTFHRDDVAERVEAQLVTPGYFELLGIEPRLGRTLEPAEGVAGAARSALVSHGFWYRQLGADPRAVGRPISLDGRDYTVVGVLPPDTGPLQEGREVFPALQLEPPSRRGPFFLRVIARLAPGADRTAAEAEISAINQRLFPIWRDSHPEAGIDFRIEALQEYVVGDAGTPLVILLGAVALVWLIAATNAANLLIARGARRRRELAVRSALGASRGRLLRHLLVESALLAAGGAGLGLALAAVAVRVLSVAGPRVLPRAAELGLGGPVLGFTAAVTAASLVLFGLIPALRVIGAGWEPALPAAGRTGTANRRTQRVRRLLVASQFAVAVPLLVGAGLLMASFLRLQRVSPGFPAERLLTVQLPLSNAAYPDPESQQAFWRRALERAAALPGVMAVGAGVGRPPSEFPFDNNFNLEDRPTPPGDAEPHCPWTVVTPGYFNALGIPLLRGRLFDSRDGPDAPVAVVVDRNWAQRFFPGEEAVGRRLTSGGCNLPECPRLTVVGVAGDVKYAGLEDPGQGVVYLVDRQQPMAAGYLFVRTAAEPLALLPALRSAIRELDPALPLTRVATMEELLRDDLAAPRNFLTLIAGFAIMALLLAAVGIYGVMSFFVQQHAREIGIRIAVGCERGSVLALVVGRGLTVAALGLAAGLAGALALTRFLSSQLFEVSPTDAPTYALVVAGLAATALAACLIPAWRAARLDPVATLRVE